jgi:hypothetical protein
MDLSLSFTYKVLHAHGQILIRGAQMAKKAKKAAKKAKPAAKPAK